MEYVIYIETTDADGNLVDEDITGLSHPTHGANFYSDVIEYDASSITEQVFGQGTKTWWE